MNYLKTYKLFENSIPTKEFLLDIQDILLEIEDMGLFIKKNVGEGRFFVR